MTAHSEITDRYPAADAPLPPKLEQVFGRLDLTMDRLEATLRIGFCIAIGLMGSYFLAFILMIRELLPLL